MASKKVYKFNEIEDKIMKAIDTICDPVKETLSPKGRNVLFEDDKGNLFSTNDGATIVKNINVSDEVENAIIQVIKESSLKTNNEVGDGTSTSILLTQVILKEGLKMVKNGINPMDLKRKLNEFASNLIDEIKKQAINIKNDKDLYNIAKISSNNDDSISKDVVRIVKTAGTDGLVFIDQSNNGKTEIIEDTGFVIESGMLAPEMRTDQTKFLAVHKNVPVFLTDKRLYYKAEAENILSVSIKNGYKELVIVARDFIGEAISFFMANHLKGNMSILLVKEPSTTDKDKESISDLASYLGGKVIMERNGSLVDKISITDYVIAETVMADPYKTIITTKKPNNQNLRDRIVAIRSELEKDKDNKDLKKRLASLTNGIVTVKVGGRTPIEIRENLYRYEDAIFATRSAVRDGYLVGGGIAIRNAFKKLKNIDAELYPIFKKFCEANIRQIALNCGKYPEFIIESIDKSSNQFTGYNAVTDTIEDLLKVGVVDPLKVTENAIMNSISVATQIISSNHLIVNELEDND